MANNLINHIWELEEKIDTCKKIVIYGAGVYGKLTLRKLYELNIYKKVVFAVSGVPEETEIMGVDVYSIDSFLHASKDILILVAVSEKLTEELVSYLKKIGVENYIEFSNELRDYLRNEKRITEKGIAYLEKIYIQKQKQTVDELRKEFAAQQDKFWERQQKLLKENSQNIDKKLEQAQKIYRDDFQNLSKKVEQQQGLVREIKQDMSKSNEEVVDVLGKLNGYLFSERQKKMNEEAFLDPIIVSVPDNQPIVSVIIPVYNVEKYVQLMLDSICKQSLEDIEIICINDGSTDSSLAILKKNADIDKRISLYSQENRGQSVARNKGISIAKGKYLYFMDSDDILEERALETLSARMEEELLDVLYFDGSGFSTELDEEDEEVKRFQTYYRRNGNYPKVCTGLEMFRLMVLNNEFRVSPCLQMINREYLLSQKLQFHTGIIHEDNAFTFQCMAGANRVGYCGEAFFGRRVRLGSTMTTKYNFNNAYGYFWCYRDILNWIEKRELELQYHEPVEWLLNSMKNSCKRTFNNLSTIEKGKIQGIALGEQVILKQLCQ